MMMEEAIYYELLHHPAVANLADVRITPVFAPEFPADTDLVTVQPHIVYALRDASVQTSMTFTRITEEWDIHCCANNYDSMLALAEAVISALHGRSGLFGGENGLALESCHLTGYSDDASYELCLFARRLSFAARRILK